MGGITRAMNHEVFCWLVIEARLELEFAATDSLDVFTFFLGSRNEERNLQWESILHPPPLYLWAFWICSHCENHDCSNAISSTKNAASGKKHHDMACVSFGLPWFYFSFGTWQKTSSAPAKSRLLRDSESLSLDLNSISTIFNMFATHQCIRLKYRFWEFTVSASMLSRHKHPQRPHVKGFLHEPFCLLLIWKKNGSQQVGLDHLERWWIKLDSSSPGSRWVFDDDKSLLRYWWNS